MFLFLLQMFIDKNVFFYLHTQNCIQNLKHFNNELILMFFKETMMMFCSCLHLFLCLLGKYPMNQLTYLNETLRK